MSAVPNDMPTGWVPEDSFGARLALIRQALGGWNVAKAARLCRLDDQTWRNWEAGGTVRDYEKVCRQIAKAVRCDRVWLAAGGPLQNWKKKNTVTVDPRRRSHPSVAALARPEPLSQVG